MQQSSPKQKPWLLRFPSILFKTVRMKLKNRHMATTDSYAHHQIEFFSQHELWQNSDKFKEIRDLVAEYAFDSGRNSTVMDIATGNGWQAIALKARGFSHVIAGDLVPKRIEFCTTFHKTAGIDFQVFDASQIPFPDKSVDAAVISAALHDMPTAVRVQVLSELRRVTRNTIVLFEPRTFKNTFVRFVYGNAAALLDESLSVKEYVYDDLDARLADAGLDVICDENVWRGLMNIKVLKPVR